MKRFAPGVPSIGKTVSIQRPGDNREGRESEGAEQEQDHFYLTFGGERFGENRQRNLAVVFNHPHDVFVEF